jgi:hypothetical protein
MKETFQTEVTGHVVISDRETGEILLEQDNAIHPKNMATAIARGLSNTQNYQIFKMKLGNRGTYINSSQQIVFNPPITTGDTANLYNATYAEVVDEADTSVGDGNSVLFTNIANSTSTRVIVTCVIAANEAYDNSSDTTNSGQINGAGSVSPYYFDELGLFTKQTSGDLLTGSGELMLSHLIFSPIEHTGNRELVITYTLTISVS